MLTSKLTQPLTRKLTDRGSGGIYVPSGYVLLTDADGAYLTDADGAYLMELT